jgi:photosystem II stability/assembly factor-like uncharacterized protein
VQTLKDALEKVTPPAPHLAHTVMAAVREAEQRPPGRWQAVVWRLAMPAVSLGLVAALLIIALAISALVRGGGLGAVSPAQQPNPAPTVLTSYPPGSGYNVLRGDTLALGPAASASDAWIVQVHDPEFKLQSGATFSVVYRTADGGRTWERKLRFEAAYDWMRFSADGRSGVVWGFTRLASQAPPTGLIYRTSDGGDHWTAGQTPAGLVAYTMFFLDPDHGWAIMHPPSGSAATLYATGDGGQTWERRGPLPATFAIHSLTGSALHELQFSDLQHGVLAPNPAAGGWPQLQVTSDGGRTWQRATEPGAQAVADRAQAASGPPTIFADGTGFLAVVVPGYGSRAAPNVLYVSSTADHGRTWSSPRRAIGLASEAAREFVLPPQLGSPQFLDTRHWWILAQVPAGTGAGIPVQTVFVTADGGQTWSRALPNPRILHLEVATPSAGWAVFEDYAQALTRLARTTDGGAHWTPVTIPLTVSG